MPCVELTIFFKTMWQHFECKQMLNKIQHIEFKLDVWMSTLHVYWFIQKSWSINVKIFNNYIYGIG
jgi:hypothetical protein